MATILAIDPGPEKSAYVVLDGQTVPYMGYETNGCLLQFLRSWAMDRVVAIEMIASYGMPVGAEIFETCVWIGRFIQKIDPQPMIRVCRREVKMHLCNSVRAKDSNVRQALADMWGGRKCKGTKKNPGPLYGISGDMWAALGVAVTYARRPT